MFLRHWFLAACVFGIGCSNNKTARPTPTEAATSATTPDATIVASADAGDPDTGVAPEPPLVGADYVAQAKTLARLVACQGSDPIPPKLDQKVVDEHCKEMATLIAEYKKSWIDVAMPFIAKLVPKGLPDKIVYPFGGGDLLGALATYPDGVEYTTISLETASDVRRVDQIGPWKLKGELARYRSHISKLFEKAHSRTDNLDIGSKSDFPGQIVFSLVALEVHGYEPTSLRYFRIEPDGTLHYYDENEVKTLANKAKLSGKNPDETVFSNMELRFRKKGDTNAKTKLLRHVGANLDDWHLKADPSLVKHLEAKGKFAAMTKAATHLLWMDNFSIIRNTILAHTDFMISDSTGVPPRFAKAAGFVQDTYGTFVGASEFGSPGKKDVDELVKLFKTNPHVDVPFRYGYPDADHHGHIVVTRKPSP
jgi:hypothetical protein